MKIDTIFLNRTNVESELTGHANVKGDDGTELRIAIPGDVRDQIVGLIRPLISAVGEAISKAD